MHRPQHLPDFRFPPLDEVVLGIQFAPVRGYQQIYAKEVWELFRCDFPNVQEQPPLPPMFETFGLPQGGQISFGISMTLPHNRFWFLSKDKEQLIQFQSDRLLHNWRRVGDKTNEYPRFERIIETFEYELHKLDKYSIDFSKQGLSINQCEISYINHIPAKGESTNVNPEHWLRFLSSEHQNMDDFSVTFRHVILGEDGKPQGRLICEATLGGDAKGRRLIVLSLTARGAPSTPDIDGALKFLKRGRETVVTAFANMTTDSAHQEWGRT